MSAYSLKCLSFGGTDEYVTFGNVLNFERNLPFSISFWMKTSNTGGGYILGKYSTTTLKGYSLFCNVTSGTLVWSLTGGGSGGTITKTSSASFLTYGSWAHCVLTYDGSSTNAGLGIWKNGVSVGNPGTGGPLTATIVNTDALLFGVRLGASYYIFQMDEGAYYDKVLSGAEIAWVYNSGLPRALDDTGCPSNLVAWWRMGEGDTYPTVLDQTVNNYDGTMMNMETTDFQDVYLAGGLINYAGYSDGKFSARGGDLGLSGVQSKNFRGRPVMTCFLGAGAGTEQRFYKMRAQDSLAALPGYVTWVVPDEPDFAGAGYSGGLPTPVGPPVGGSIIVASDWWESA